VTTTTTTVPTTTTTSATATSRRAPTTTGPTTTVPATTAPASAPGGQPPGGPVPAGFDPVSFTAVSTGEFWLLGEAPCQNPVCTSIVRTTDGGSHFVGLPAPTVPLDVDAAGNGGVNTLRFADPMDGYAYDSFPGGSFWDTHDGGEEWQQPAFMTGKTLLGFGTGAGYAFALVGSCANGNCSGVVLERSPVSSEQWQALSVPVPSGVDQVAAMAVRGSNLWISVSRSATAAHQLLVVGSGSGASFTTYASPCFPGLGGTIEAASASNLWAVCPTGMMAEALSSQDGGAHWAPVTAAGELENSALLAPASASTAVLQEQQGQLLRTDDGGASWQKVYTAPSGSSWAWIGFTDSMTGSGLQMSSTSPAGWPWPDGPAPETLWRTSDGGASWSGPVAIG